jgi:RimJ/RimL family protein N-acetyltransferase
MLGDVNLFLHTSDATDDENDDPSAPSRPPRITAELEIMLPPSSPLYKPRTGLALETLQLFISYATKYLNLKPEQFMVKIGFDNEPSLRLFEKLGFVEKKRVEIFREIEMGYKGLGDTESRWEWEREGEGWEVGILEDPRDPARD